MEPSIGGGNDQCPTFDGNIDNMSFWTAALDEGAIKLSIFKSSRAMML